MKVITLARKPYPRSTIGGIQDNGCGSINVDGTRVAHLEVCKTKNSQESFNSLFVQSGRREDTLELKPEGRWPANLVLEHHPNCVFQGVQKVKTSSAGSKSLHDPYGGISNTGFLRGHSVPGTNQHADSQGRENVSVWGCHSDCPVVDMDQQSGIMPTGGWIRHDDTAHPFGNAVGKPYSHWKSVEEPEGGASRCFKQFQKE